MKAIIVGGGIGGLTTALMLHARGIDCQIFEAAPEVKELGVGINVLPHAIKELAEIGLLPALDAIGIRTRELIYSTRSGQEIWREPRGVDAGFDVPQFSIHRGHLQKMLYNAVLERLGSDAIVTAQPCSGYSQSESCATAHFAEGASIKAASGDVLIAADGIHSAIRKQMFPAEPGLKWNGVMMWRGAVEREPFLDGRTMIVAGGFTYKLVLYPIARGSQPGKVLTNWVVTYRPGAEGDVAPKREDWNRRGTHEELMPHVEKFGIDPAIIDLAALVRSTETFFEYPMCDRDPLPWWTDGRVALIGDAAHPMYPVGSNGASQAIIDARTLADCLASAEHGRAALAAYQAIRLPATAEIVRLNRKGGPEGVIDEVERRAPEGCDDLDAVITFTEREAIVRGYAAKAGFTQAQVNQTAAPVQYPHNAAI
ncbi:flavin-dependent oxidoreductase [Limoniibacter endophyticus]|uniref:Salicylate 1-monooxygenase n=1 Tax=Limoniibacter endophyticus TaxID=1565040 RepID=A0A8J3DIE6_9HYPH|nr:flavin-dependent oxidoreductase [Limoniibacter endophyticus]GHC70283.1 salicylate 1-monooxygenase [Limoniibacter endophyticus]